MSKPQVAEWQKTEPPRIRKFRKQLIQAIPRFPNTKASLQHMEQKHLGEVMIAYLNWRSRYVGARPRKVIIEANIQSDFRWISKANEISKLLTKVQAGDDLTPHLSLKPRTKGYSPQSRMAGATPSEKWEDKDFQLNTKGYHHFHLGTALEKGGIAARTDDLLFAHVERDTFTVIAIFSHEVFNLGSEESVRFGKLHQSLIFRGHPPGTVLLSNPITTSGHALHVVTYAGRCARTIGDLDANLDDQEFARNIYKDKTQAPLKPKPTWYFHHLDFGILDMTNRAFLCIHKGWN